MNDYFASVDVEFFNKTFFLQVNDIADYILSKVNTSENLLPEYEYTHHTKILFYNDIIKQIPTLGEFLYSINANVNKVPILGFVPPNSLMGIHTDGYGCFTKILLPIKGEDPLHFYNSRDDEIPACTLIPKINSPIVFNTEKLHGGVRTNNEWRVNFQIMLTEPYDIVLERIKNNSLFKL